jgi:hypothetical protein
MDCPGSAGPFSEFSGRPIEKIKTELDRANFEVSINGERIFESIQLQPPDIKYTTKKYKRGLDYKSTISILEIPIEILENAFLAGLQS